MDEAMIERLAREAGVLMEPGMPIPFTPGPLNAKLRRFAALVAEECARATESSEVQTLAEAAAAIRAKFKEPTSG